MSHYRVKTTFEVVNFPYGDVTKHTLYCHHNLSADITTFYDENGTYIFSYQDTDDNNLFDAIKRLVAPHKGPDFRELSEGVEYMTPEESYKCGI